MTFVALLFFVIGLFAGAIAMGKCWQGELVRQNKAHYIVDSQTGETELVWVK